MEKALRQYKDLEIQLEDILSATNNFDDENNYIGGGGFGRVYKGEVSHSKGRSMVAVKRLGSRCGQGIPEFLKEIRTLSRYQHENLVSLLGFCCKGHDEMILVYEYASNGSLDRHLNSPHLTWTRRINICLDVAKGISYLHDPRESHQRLIHCDIKSANILLDEQWRAKVTDFGLSIMGPAKEQDSLIVTSAVGTYGYCDPEYAMTHTLTKESDVYSFGVVLFEVLCGTLCCTYSNGRVEQILVSTWVESYKVKKLNDIIFKDPTVQPLDQSSLERFSNIAYRCLNENREDRPKMAEVVTELESALKLQEFSGQITSSKIATDKKQEKNRDPSSSQSGTAEKDLTANPDSGNNVGQEGQNRVVQKGEKKGKMGWFTKWFKPNPILSNPTNSGQEGQNGVVKKKEKDEIERPRGETELESAPSSETVRPGGERRRSKPNPRLSNPTMNLHGEQVAAGWPAWLSAVAGEAINGWIPRRADTFEKIDKIGQGTYSNVYKAKDTMTGKIVAMKRVRFDNLEPESVKFMAREIVILRRLDHPNVVKLEGLVTSRMSCSLYLVFEYMEHDLAGLAASPTIRFTEPQVKCYMHQLFSGLEHCHNRYVLHRDIKGSDILLNNDGSLKIADFGLASFFDPNQKHRMTSQVITLWYRPLELLLGATDYGVGIDLWSAGCILAELLAGKPIMPGRTETEQLHKIFKLCGSPSEEYWKKLKLPHANIFKPEQAYERCIAETFKNFPASSLPLIETLLAIDPAERQTATAALRSEFFTTQPYACDPSSIPKYPPTKEMDAKLRDEEARRLRAAGKSNADGVKTTRTRERHARAMPAPEANAELQANIDRRRLITHANAKKQSEKCHPPHQEGTLGYPFGSSHDMDPTFDPPDVPFSSNFSYAKQPIHPLAEPAPTGHS